MDRSQLARLAPVLAGCRGEWLEDAELSLFPHAPDAAGLSLFLEDPRAHSELLGRLERGQELAENDRRTRRRFPVVPLQWVKLSYVGGELTGLSQYFNLHPVHDYPIASVRVFVRQFGGSGADRLEGLLGPSMALPGASWGLALKYPSQEAPTPRVYGRLARGALPAVLCGLESEGWLSAGLASEYLAACDPIKAGDHVYLSVDPGVTDGVSVDLEDVLLVDAPLDAAQLPASVPLEAAARYLKCRIPGTSRVPQWTVYLPLQPP
ncbi:MAG: hypothetical protein GF320_08710 [Armatimonadia bacterium]|nr:hypothetical protein [Armatimonadia bacterium]